MNTPVTFEIAKLLKDKGFNEISQKWYSVEGGLYYQDEFDNNRGFIPVCECEAPTIAEVVMWLYEKHGIWINVECDCYAILWYSKLSVASENNWNNIDLRHEIISADKKFPNEHNSPTEAYEAAIEYTLNNLI